jgi:hypothetical protein
MLPPVVGEILNTCGRAVSTLLMRPPTSSGRTEVKAVYMQFLGECDMVENDARTTWTLSDGTVITLENYEPKVDENLDSNAVHASTHSRVSEAKGETPTLFSRKWRLNGSAR